MKMRSIEISVGLFLLVGIMALVILAFQVSGLAAPMRAHGYTLYASFDNVGDLKVRAPVSIAGVRVGQVTGVRLDSITYRAVVSLYIEDKNEDDEWA